MSSPVTDGDRFARARVEFVEAMAAGCTIPELRRRKRALAHRAKAEVARFVADQMTGSPNLQPYQRDWLAQSDAWMMRD